MDRRLELHEKLCKILGTRNVYFQPPESVKMKYDAIRYKLGGVDLKRANNGVYLRTKQYDGVVIALDPETTVPDSLLEEFEMCSLGIPYVTDNLYHFPFTIYY